MAERSAVPSNPGANAGGVTVFTWTGITESDTGEEILVNGQGPCLLAMQVLGTFGGATVQLQGSNNGTDWVTVADVQGDTSGFSAAGGKEFSPSFVYLRPNATGGTSQTVNVIIATRG